MRYNTLLIREDSISVTITLNRPARRNSLNEELIKELISALNIVQASSERRVVILEGQDGVFCTGMDFEEVASQNPEESGGEEKNLTRMYMDTLRRLSLMPRVVIAKVDGQVMAGGVGLVAACDLAVATPRSQFSLSEALWGLLPSMVVPYLMRRVGFQKAYSMTLTTLPISAREALDIYLIDELGDAPDEIVKRLCQRLSRLDNWTIENMKNYFRKVWIITEKMEEMAVNETSRLVAHPKVRENIENFVKYQVFPWNKSDHSQES